MIETQRDLPFLDIVARREALVRDLQIAKHTLYGKRHWWGPGGRHQNPNRDVEKMFTASLLQAAGIETIFVEAPAEYQPLIDRVQQWGRLSLVIFPMAMRQLVNLQDNPAALGFEPHWKGENCLIPHLLFFPPLEQESESFVVCLFRKQIGFFQTKVAEKTKGCSGEHV